MGPLPVTDPIDWKELRRREEERLLNPAFIPFPAEPSTLELALDSIAAFKMFRVAEAAPTAGKAVRIFLTEAAKDATTNKGVGSLCS